MHPARLFLLSLAAVTAHANSQSQPAEQGQVKAQVPAKDTPQPVTQVEIVAERPTNRIDRQVYELKSDLSTSNASAADALANVPSVQVEPDGSVRLRGNQNVTILLDGKPSAMLSGDSRGAALNAMPADFIESIEVVNNPGAEFGNEGGGGPILNLVTRRNRRPGGFGALLGNWGTAGRYNGGVNGSYSAGYAAIDTFLNYRHDGRNNTSHTEREAVDPITRAISPSSFDTNSHGLNGNLNFHSNFRYNVGTADRMGGSVGVQRGGRDNASDTRYHYLASDGTLSSEQQRHTETHGRSSSHSASAFYEHKLEGEDELLKGDWRISSSNNPSDSDARRRYLAGTFLRPDEISSQHREPDTRVSDVTLDYTGRQLGGFVASGLKLVDTRQDFDTRYALEDPLSGEWRPNPVLSNAFSVNEQVAALYGSYEYRFDEQWSAKGGVRGEHTDLAIHQLTSHIDTGNHYANWMPSAYLQYKRDKDTIWRLAYSHRLHRPNAADLNPYVVYQSPTDRSAGNPRLKPAQSDSFELSYDSLWAGMKTDLRLFARNEYDVVTQRQNLIKDETGQDVVLTTRENFGSNRSRGIEFVFNGKPLTGVTLNVSGNLRRAEQTQFASLGQAATLSGTSLGGRARGTWQVDADDQLQLALNAQGKQLWGQGYREPNWTANMTWQRKLSPLLTLTVNGTDIFRTNRNESHTDSDLLHQTSLTRYDSRVIYIGFRYQLGGVTGNERMRQMREGGPRGEGGRAGPGAPGMQGGS